LPQSTSLHELITPFSSAHIFRKSTKKNSEVSKTQTQALPWVEKYRPSSLEDLIAHDSIISTSK
jgi:hypothetical protein